LIRLIAIDLDGTLLNSKSSISIRNKEAIEKCLKRGIKVILSTGKTIFSVGKLIRELHLTDPQIAAGGAAIIDRELNLLLTLKVPQASYIGVVKMARVWGRGHAVQTTDGVLYYDREHPLFKYLTAADEPLKKVRDLTSSHIAENSLILTLTIDCNDSFNEYLKSNIGNDIKVRRGGPYFLNVLNKEAGKVFGIKKILEITGIKQSQVLAIGDSENDLGVIKFAGTGVAMENSPQAVKRAADYVVSKNDKDGVAEAIYKYLDL